MANTQDIGFPTMKVLIYGPAGVGKTRLSASFPNPHFVDLDNGMLTVAGRDITYYTINSRPSTDPDFIKLFGEKVAKDMAFLKATKLIEHWANSLTKDQTLVIDSWSFLNDYVMQYVLAVEKQKTARIQDWGAGQKLLEGILEALNDVECNLVVIAHDQFLKDEESGFVSWMPLTIGKLATKIPIYFDEVWRGYSEPGRVDGKNVQVYGIECQPTRRTTAKSRLDLPFKIDNPTYDTVMGLRKQIVKAAAK